MHAPARPAMESCTLACPSGVASGAPLGCGGGPGGGVDSASQPQQAQRPTRHQQQERELAAPRSPNTCASAARTSCDPMRRPPLHPMVRPVAAPLVHGATPLPPLPPPALSLAHARALARLVAAAMPTSSSNHASESLIDPWPLKDSRVAENAPAPPTGTAQKGDGKMESQSSKSKASRAPLLHPRSPLTTLNNNTNTLLSPHSQSQPPTATATATADAAAAAAIDHCAPTLSFHEALTPPCPPRTLRQQQQQEAEAAKEYEDEEAGGEDPLHWRWWRPETSMLSASSASIPLHLRGGARVEPNPALGIPSPLQLHPHAPPDVGGAGARGAGDLNKPLHERSYSTPVPFSVMRQSRAQESWLRAKLALQTCVAERRQLASYEHEYEKRAEELSAQRIPSMLQQLQQQQQQQQTPSSSHPIRQSLRIDAPSAAALPSVEPSSPTLRARPTPSAPITPLDLSNSALDALHAIERASTAAAAATAAASNERLVHSMPVPSSHLQLREEDVGRSLFRPRPLPQCRSTSPHWPLPPLAASSSSRPLPRIQESVGGAVVVGLPRSAALRRVQEVAAEEHPGGEFRSPYTVHRQACDEKDMDVLKHQRTHFKKEQETYEEMAFPQPLGLTRAQSAAPPPGPSSHLYGSGAWRSSASRRPTAPSAHAKQHHHYHPHPSAIAGSATAPSSSPLARVRMVRAVSDPAAYRATFPSHAATSPRMLIAHDGSTDNNGFPGAAATAAAAVHSASATNSPNLPAPENVPSLESRPSSDAVSNGTGAAAGTSAASSEEASGVPTHGRKDGDNGTVGRREQVPERSQEPEQQQDPNPNPNPEPVAGSEVPKGDDDDNDGDVESGPPRKGSSFWFDSYESLFFSFQAELVDVASFIRDMLGEEEAAAGSKDKDKDRQERLHQSRLLKEDEVTAAADDADDDDDYGGVIPVSSPLLSSFAPPALRVELLRLLRVVELGQQLLEEHPPIGERLAQMERDHKAHAHANAHALGLQHYAKDGNGHGNGHGHGHTHFNMGASPLDPAVLDVPIHEHAAPVLGTNSCSPPQFSDKHSSSHLDLSRSSSSAFSTPSLSSTPSRSSNPLQLQQKQTHQKTKYRFPVPSSQLLHWRRLLSMELAVATWSESEWRAAEATHEGATALVSARMIDVSDRIQSVYEQVESFNQTQREKQQQEQEQQEQQEKDDAAHPPVDPSESDSQVLLPPSSGFYRLSMDAPSASPTTALVDEFLFLQAELCALFHVFPLLIAHQKRQHQELHPELALWEEERASTCLLGTHTLRNRTKSLSWGPGMMNGNMATMGMGREISCSSMVSAGSFNSHSRGSSTSFASSLPRSDSAMTHRLYSQSSDAGYSYTGRSPISCIGDDGSDVLLGNGGGGSHSGGWPASSLGLADSGLFRLTSHNGSFCSLEEARQASSSSSSSSLSSRQVSRPGDRPGPGPTVSFYREMELKEPSDAAAAEEAAAAMGAAAPAQITQPTVEEAVELPVSTPTSHSAATTTSATISSMDPSVETQEAPAASPRALLATSSTGSPAAAANHAATHTLVSPKPARTPQTTAPANILLSLTVPGSGTPGPRPDAHANNAPPRTGSSPSPSLEVPHAAAPGASLQHAPLPPSPGPEGRRAPSPPGAARPPTPPRAAEAEEDDSYTHALIPQLGLLSPPLLVQGSGLPSSFTPAHSSAPSPARTRTPSLNSDSSSYPAPKECAVVGASGRKKKQLLAHHSKPSFLARMMCCSAHLPSEEQQQEREQEPEPGSGAEMQHPRWTPMHREPPMATTPAAAFHDTHPHPPPMLRRLSPGGVHAPGPSGSTPLLPGPRPQNLQHAPV